MKLPKTTTTTYELTLPGKSEKIKYRPFLYKDYKAILHAKDLGDDGSFTQIIKEIVSDCLFGAVDVDNLPIYTIDYIFLMLRSKSIGEMVEAEYQCHNILDDKTVCGQSFRVNIELEKAFVRFPKDYNAKSVIKIDEHVGLKLTSPTFSKFRSVGIAGKDLFDITDEYIFSCVECVYTDEEVLVPGKDFTLDELKDWIQTLPTDVIMTMKEWFKNQPFISLTLNLRCPKCRNESTIELKGISDFFE